MEKINVIILLCQIETFQGLKNLYDFLKTDNNFNITVVLYNMTNFSKKMWIHNESPTDTLKKNGLDFITHKNGDLKYLKPNYVFYQTPYMVHYPPELRIENVKKYSKTCYFGYGYTIWSTKLILDSYIPFLKQLDFHFVDNDYYYNDLFEHFKQKGINSNYFRPRTFTVGMPKVCRIKYTYTNNFKCKNFGWTPRWVPEQSNFEEYYKFFTNYFKDHKNLSLECRFHPLDKNKSRNLFLKNISDIDNINKTSELFYDKFFERTDILISDLSSMISEFFPTGKPIILIYKNTYMVDSIGSDLLRGVYVVKNKKELIETIDKLRDNIDPLRDIRKDLIKKHYHSYSPLEDISKLMLDDYKKNNLSLI